MTAAGIASEAVSRHGAAQDVQELTDLIHLMQTRWRPVRILEIGSNIGGTLWAWRQITSDVAAITLNLRADGMLFTHGAFVLNHDSRDRAAWQVIDNHWSGDHADLVFIDGGHDVGTCQSDLHTARAMYPGAVIVMHDIAAHLYLAGIEVHQVWKTARQAGDYLEIIRQPGRTPGYGILLPGGD